MKNEISLARILLATACPGNPALWAGSFTQGESLFQYRAPQQGKEENPLLPNDTQVMLGMGEKGRHLYAQSGSKIIPPNY